MQILGFAIIAAVDNKQRKTKMTKVLNIPNRVIPATVSTDDYEENELKEMEKSILKYSIGRLIKHVRQSEDFSFDETCMLVHELRTLLFDGNSNKALRNI